MSDPHHRDPFQTAWRTEAILIRRRLIRLQDETRSLRHALARKYNPNQPRVPAGNSNGGQWTDGNSGGGGGSGSFADLGSAFGLGNFGSFGEGAAGLIPAVDPTGDEEAWSSYAETVHEDGSLATTGVTNKDGTRIYSEYAEPGQASDWDERHTVTLPDGSRTTFETTGKTQTIREGGPDGPILSRTTWTPDGPEPEATVRQAFAPAIIVAPAVVAAGTLLFGWLSQQEIDGQRTVMGFAPRDYRPTQTEGKIDLNFVAKLSNEEVESACRRMPDVQEAADRAARAAGHPNQFPSMAAYGRAVHSRFEKFILDLNDINLRPEPSFLREGFAPPADNNLYRGYGGTVRPDAYEYIPETGTLCLYDVKAGKKEMSAGRSDIIAMAAIMGFKNVQRLIFVQVRPRP